MSDRLATVLAGYAPAAREAARSTLAGALEYSFTAGENPLVAARTISRQFAGITYTRAATIARTEMAVAGWDGAQADFAADPVVKAWQWMATFDGNACEICSTMHGTEYPTSDRLESHPNCRCTMVPVTDNFRPIGAGQTGVERMQGMSEADLLRIWGPGRAALIRGGMNPMDLIGSRTHRVFGRQPVLKPLRSLRQADRPPNSGVTYRQAIETWTSSADQSKEIRYLIASGRLDDTSRTIVDLIANHSTPAPRLYRGIATRDPDRFVPGKTIDLGPSSFSSSKSIAQDFMFDPLDGMEGATTKVLFRLDGARAANIEPLAPDFWKHQKEWITGGRFRVTSTSYRGDVLEVNLSHEALLTP